MPDNLLSLLKKVYTEIVARPQKYLFLAILILITFYAFFGDYGLFQRVKYEYLRYKYQTELNEAQQETRELKDRIKKAGDLDEIERVAREKYNLTKEGEKVYIIKSK
jgi:cell division protein FtsB